MTQNVPIPNSGGGSPAPSFTFISDTNTGMYMSSSNIFSISSGGTFATRPASASASDILDLYLQGKTMKDDAKEYIDVILQLPWVNGDQLKMLEAFERFRRMYFTE